MPSTTIIQATSPFTFDGPGGRVNIRKGETFHRESSRLEGISDEALEQNFKVFTPDNDVEKATAGPGERRKGGPHRTKGTEAKKHDEATKGTEDATSKDAETEKK